jgi:hypothetical protein
MYQSRGRMTFGSASLARIWKRWFSRRSSRRSVPLLRLVVAPRSLGPSWHPAKGPGGRRQLQVLIDLEARNITDRDIRIIRAELTDHRAEQTSFTIGPLDDGPSQSKGSVPALGAARIKLMFFLKPRSYRPGEAFADVLTLVDDEGREHRLKVVMRGR